MKDWLSITLVQTNLIWENKAANLAMLEDKINSIGATHIIALPEMFSTGFTMQPEKLAEEMEGTTLQWLKAMAKNKKAIITGSMVVKEEDNYYNRMVWVQPDGTVHHYNKRHLFGTAGENEHYTSGDKRVVVSVNGWRLLLQVCYDLRFPVWSRQQLGEKSEAEYDVILYVANWPERRNLAWKTLLQARAIENQCYVVGVNRVGEDGNEIYHSGDSSVFDAMGSMLYQVAHREDVHTVNLSSEELLAVREKLPFLKDADCFTVIEPFK